MAVDIATLALRVDALEVANAEKKLDKLVGAGKRAESSAKSITTTFKALAGVLATIKIAQVVKDSAMMAARYETMGAAMNTVGNNAGYTVQQMDAYEQKLRSTGIAMTEARETLTKMASAQIDLAKSSDLARVAQDAAVIGGVNSSEAFNRMIDGIRSGEVEILKTIGLGVNFEAAYKRTAAQLGKNTNQLTTHEKTQARVNETLKAGILINGTYVASMGKAGKQLLSMQRYIDDLKVKFGAAFGPAMTMIVGQLTGELKGITTWAGKNKEEIEDWGDSFRNQIIGVERFVIRLKMKLDEVGGTLTTLVSNIADAHDNIFQSFGSDLNPKFKEILGPELTGKSGLKKWALEKNKMYEERYKAAEQSLKDLDALEKKYIKESLTGTSTLEQRRQKQDEQSRIKAAEEARKKLEEEEKNLLDGSGGNSKAAKAASQYADEVERTLDRLLPLRAATQDYAESLGYLNSALSTGTITKDQYGTALEALNREFEDAKKQANAYAQAMKDAERATQESALAINGTKIEIAIAQGQLTELEALPFQIDLLQQRLDIQKEYLTEMQKSTPEEITAWNSQAEAIAQTTLQLAQYQQTLRLQDPYQGMIQGFKDIAEEAKITGQDINDYLVGAFEQLNDALVNFLVDGDSFGDVFNSLSKEMLSMTTKSLITGPLFGGIGGMLGIDGAGSLGVGGNVSITAPAMVSINGGLSGTGGLLDSLFPSSSEFGESWFGSFFNSGSSQGTNWWDSFYDAGASALSSIAGLFSGGSSGGSSGVNYTAIAMAAASAFHGGGVVGNDEPAFIRNVPSSVFRNAPKYHSGLLPDEFPAILQRGESVFTKGQTKAIGSALSGGDSGETKALLRELIGAVKAGGSTKIVNAFDAETVANAMSGNSGNKVMLNHVRSNPSAYRAALGV